MFFVYRASVNNCNDSGKAVCLWLYVLGEFGEIASTGDCKIIMIQSEQEL